MDAHHTPATRRIVALLAAGTFGIAAPLAAVSIADAAVQRHHGHSHSKDWDRDKMPNRWELKNGLDAHKANARQDPDSDALTNLAEFQAGTDPLADDTDGDGFEDGDDANPTCADDSSGTIVNDPSDDDQPTRSSRSC
jgi:hypothetical protein